MHPNTESSIVETASKGPPWRLRITFAKTAPMRYTGHLDLHRAWERTFRRAGLPLAYSQGFNPRPRLNLASALPLGFTSQGEVLDVWLEQDLANDAVLESLHRALPPGLQIHQIEAVDLKEPALQTELEAAEYLLTWLEPFPDLEKKVEDLLAHESLPRTRRKKVYDLRPLIQTMEIILPDQAGNPRLRMILSAHEGATGRPEEVVEALGADVHMVRIERFRLIFHELLGREPHLQRSGIVVKSGR